MRQSVVRRSLLALAIAASFPALATAQDGSWNVDANGNWTDTANWAGGIAATGTGFTATFANDITADRTVTLTAPQTIGNLIFGDTDPATAGAWIVTNGGTAANILTLDATTPTITVNDLGAGKSATISAVIAGSAGLVKSGTGLLILNADNTYTGGTTIGAGTLRISNTNQLEGATSIASAATLNWQLTNSTQTLANVLTGTGTLQVDLIGTTGANATASGLSGFSGTVRISAPSGATANKLAIATGGAPNAELVVDNGGQFFASNTGTFKALSLVGTGNNETRGALRITSAITVTNGVTLTGNTTIGTEGGSITGSLQGTAAAATTQTLTFGTANSTGSLSINGVISDGTAGGNLALTKTQAGALTLNGNNTYTGATTVSGGRVTPTGSNVSAFTFASGTTLGSSGTGSTTGLLTLNAGANIALAGGATLTGFTGNSVNIAGATNVTFDTAAVTGNTYTVLNYSSLTGFSNLALQTGHGTFTNTGSAVTLTYLGAGATSIWNTTTGAWDQTSTNWTNSIDNKYGNGDNVIFNEPSAPSTVTVSGTVTPASVTINNSTNAYTIGTGVIGGAASVYKTGTGSVTLSGANTYTGGTTIAQGTLITGANAGAGTGTIILGDSTTGSNNVMLSQSATFATSNSILISSWGTGTATITSAGNPATPTYSGVITMNRPTTISYAGSDRLNFTGTLTGSVGTLTITGGKRTTFVGATGNFQGDILITGGSGTILQLGTAGAVSNNIPDWSNVTVDTGTQFNFSYSGSGTETFNALNGTGSVGVNSATTNTMILGAYNGSGSFSGAISGAGNLGLTKLGSGTQTMAPAATYTYTRPTTVNGGTLALSFGGSLVNNVLATTSALTLGGGTLQVTGTNTATQTVNGLTTTSNTGSRILLGANKTLTLGALTSAGANSALNFNTAAGGADAVTSTLGSSLVKLTGQTAGNVINTGFTVTDSTGFGLATVDGANNVVRLTSGTLLPASGSVAATNYRIDNNAGGVSADGSSTLTISASQATNSITVDTTAASGTLTLDTGVTLSNNLWNFGGTGSNTYNITGGTGITSVASAGTMLFNNYNASAVTISSPILANGVNPVLFAGTGTTILAGTNTYTGGTTINGGTLQIGPGALDGTATTGSINVGSTITVNSGAKLIYNRTVTTPVFNPLAGNGIVELYGSNTGGPSGAASITLNTGSGSFSGTMFVNGVRLNNGTSTTSLGTALVTIQNSGQLYAGAATLSNNFVISGLGWGESGGNFGTMRLDGTTLNGWVNLAGDSRISTSGSTGTINGVIGESGGARKLTIGSNYASGSTVMTLNAANAYTGGTDLIAGTGRTTTVNLGNNNALSSGTVNVLNNSTLVASGAARTIGNSLAISSGSTASLSGAGGQFTLNGLLSGAGAVNVSAGTVVLTNANTYTGGTTLTAGSLILSGGDNRLATTGALNFAGDSTLDLNGSSQTVSALAFNVSTANAAATINSTGGPGTLNSTGTVFIGNPDSNYAVKSLTLNNINFTAGGLLSVGYVTAGGSGGTGQGNLIVNGGSLTAGTLRLAYVRYNTGAIAPNVAGTVTLDNAVAKIATINLVDANHNNNSMSGTANFNINNGSTLYAQTIADGGGNATTTRNINFNWNNGTIRNYDANTNLTISAWTLRDGGTGLQLIGSGLHAFEADADRTITVNQVINGAGALTKNGAGTLTLSAANTYTGTTTVNAGTMVVTGTLVNNGPANILMAAPDDSLAGNPILTRAIPAGLNAYAGFGSSVTATSLDPVLNIGLQTTATILMSGNNATANSMSMQWRTRTVAESQNLPNGVISDVLDLSGMGNDLFVLQMSYTQAALDIAGTDENAVATSGELRLGWNDNGVWKTAFQGNSVPTGTFAGAISWSTFVSNNGVALDGSNLTNFLGAYGVDPSTNVVWAVLDHNSEFAVIPEPSMLVLGALGALGLGMHRLRRRKTC